MANAKSKTQLLKEMDGTFTRHQDRFAITPYRKTSLSEAHIRKIDKQASLISEQNRHLSSTAYFGENVKIGDSGNSAILISDRSEIRLVPNTGTDPLAYRMALLGCSDDTIILNREQNNDFEHYLDSILMSAICKALTLPNNNGPTVPTAIRCYSEPEIFNPLIDNVCKNNGVTLIPYISTGSVWKLASKLAEQTGQNIDVAGPPPILSARINDKLWFADCVRRLFGKKSIPTLRSAYTLAGLTSHVHQLSKKWGKLVIKVPDSAGSAGNFPLRSENVRPLKAKALQNYLCEVLSPRISKKDFPLMVQVWDSDIIASPSAQMWIPLPEDGLPVIEGIYDQLVIGEKGTFIGATLSKLDKKMESVFCNQAMQLAVLFQKLGYYGRCSFDSVISCHPSQDKELHWIECNGRWGGVSLPMTFLNRIFEGKDKPEFIIVQYSGLDFNAMNFKQVLERVKQHLYYQNRSEEGIIFTSPSGVEDGNALQLIALGPSMENAKWHLQEVQKILGII